MNHICPICGNEYSEPPAISRKDNQTEICPICGMIEALQAFGLNDSEVEMMIERMLECQQEIEYL